MNETQAVTARAKEVSKRYGIGLSTVWYLAREGKIRPIQVTPRVTVFNIKELDKFFGVDVDEVA